MKRWAHFIITAVKHDEYKRVIEVEVRIDTIEQVKGTIILTKDDVIKIIDDGGIFVTAYRNGTDSAWQQGALVAYFTEKNGIKYLITSSNSSSKDNLDNLPKF